MVCPLRKRRYDPYRGGAQECWEDAEASLAKATLSCLKELPMNQFGGHNPPK
jgi:hypothetical protein